MEKGVDGASLIVVALRIQRGIYPEIKVELTPLLLPQAVFKVGPKGVCVVDVMRQMTVRAVEDLPVFGHAGQQVDRFREAGVGIRQAVQAIDALLLAPIAMGEPIAQHELSVVFAKHEGILDEGIEFELAARRGVNELVAEERSSRPSPALP